MAWPEGRSVLSTLQHVYRRGHIFWWRRIHRLFDNATLDVRLSLGTADRFQARNRGAGLTASSQQVVEMLNEQVSARTDLTERELPAIAKAMYEERLTELCTEQRSTPLNAELYSVTNRAFVDYFQRLMSLGGHTSLLPAEEQRLEAEGWNPQRIADLQLIIAMREEKGISPIRKPEIDRHLARAGFAVDDRFRWMVELALYPAYRSAYSDAEEHLQSLVAPGEKRFGHQLLGSVGEPTKHSLSAASVEVSIPDDWLTCTPTEAAERMIAETPRLLDHRREGKRAKDSVGEQTLRQIRWAAMLLEKSLPPGTPFRKVTKQHIVELDRFFDQLPIHFGKSIHDRDPKRTLETAVALAADKIVSGEHSPDDIGLSTGTTNKHFSKLAQVHKFMRTQIGGAPGIDFSSFTAAIDEDEREARQRYTREQGEAIFRLPPWTGCKSTEDRLSSGSAIVHDGLFFVLLLVWYTGARCEELCKLMLDDVEERHGIVYLLIRPTETGGLKNRSARRVVVLPDELIRLGFRRYVEAMRSATSRSRR